MLAISLRLFCIPSCLLLAFVMMQVHAELPDHFGDPPDNRPTIENIRNFRLNGKRIPKSSMCEEVLHDTQVQFGRNLTHDEIEKNLPEILKATGEALVPEPPAPPPDRFSERWCFTGNMRVSTPRGPRPINELQVGDEVISIDLSTNTPVANKIFAIFPAHGISFGRLTDMPTPIEVSRRHRFYSSGDGLAADYRAIEEIPASADLFSADGDGRNLQTRTRGTYAPDQGTATVYDLQLTGEPRNFLVEGVLVHNGLEKL